MDAFRVHLRESDGRARLRDGTGCGCEAGRSQAVGRKIPLSRVRRCQLPADAALGSHARSGAYTDCYAVVVPRAVTQAEFVESFYTTRVFKIERWLLATLLSRPSTDAQVRALAVGSLSSFAAWAHGAANSQDSGHSRARGELRVATASRSCW